jgi:diguanylate cyclase (GGDEF)-like protein/PAS domain S-box-containing protein
MKDQSKTKQVLIQELDAQRMRIAELEQLEEVLRESEEYFKAIIHNSSDIIFILDRLGTITYASSSVERFLGYEPDDVIGKRTLDLIVPEDKPRAIADFGRALLTKEILIPNIFRIRHKNGTERILEGAGKNLFDNPIVAGFVMNVRDITERKRMEKELSNSEGKYRMMLENIQDGYYEVDLLGNLTYVNPSLSRILGYSEEELIGTNNRQYMDEENTKKVFRAFNMVYKTKVPISHFDWELIRKDKTKAFVGCSVSLIKDSFDKPVGFRGIVRDITDKKKVEEALQDSEKRYRELSIIDDLTRLYNSRYFYHQLKIEIDRAERYRQPFTLLLLDLDNFKAFNDAYGHVEGDQVLTRLGQVVKRCLRQTDSAYRYGGEEFTILLPMTTSKDAAVTAERIRTEFKKENFFPVPGKDVHLTMSIGLGQYQPQEEMKVFVHRVDQFMYQGKKNGKDRVCSES